MSLLTTRNIYIYKYKIIFSFLVMIFVWSRKAFAESSRTRISCRETEEPVNNSLAEIRELVYNSHVTCNNSSFSLTMVTPTSHFFAFHWLCCLLPIGYSPKPGSVGVRICHHHRMQPHPQAKVIFRYRRPDAPVSTSTDTQHLWAW